jgi:hypothetical protein
MKRTRVSALDGYKDGRNLYFAYFAPGKNDPTGMCGWFQITPTTADNTGAFTNAKIAGQGAGANPGNVPAFQVVFFPDSSCPCCAKKDKKNITITQSINGNIDSGGDQREQDQQVVNNGGVPNMPPMQSGGNTAKTPSGAPQPANQSFVDAPQNSATLEACAYCNENGTQTLLGCTTYTWTPGQPGGGVGGTGPGGLSPGVTPPSAGYQAAATSYQSNPDPAIP